MVALIKQLAQGLECQAFCSPWSGIFDTGTSRWERHFCSSVKAQPLKMGDICRAQVFAPLRSPSPLVS